MNLSIKRVGKVWHVTENKKTIATFATFREAAQWMVQQTNTRQLAA